MTYCATCKMPVEGSFCTHCGTPVDNASTQQYTTTQQHTTSGAPTQNVYVNNVYTRYVSHKNRMIALVLAIAFGIFGVHRFYAGKIGTGILYIFTGGLFGIGYLVDIILIAAGSFKDGDACPSHSGTPKRTNLWICEY